MSARPRRLSVVPPDRGRILIVVTHLLGVGHLARAAAIGRALAGAGHAVTLVSGGRPTPLVALDGLSLVQLPPVHCLGVDFRTLLAEDGRPASAALLQRRSALLTETLVRVEPEVVITELFPFGRRQLSAEFDALLAATEAMAYRPAMIASVRDVLNPPSRPSRVEEALDRLGRSYDRILVHGDPAVSRLWDSWPCSSALAGHIVDTGYVANHERQAPVPEADPVADGEVVVSGGGSAAALPLYRAALGMARRERGDRRYRLLVGQGLPDEAFATLVAEAPACGVVERARPDFPDVLAHAAVSVSQCGYNTMVDVAAARVRAVVVPFEEGQEAEQRLRAERFAALGLVDVVPQSELTSASLAEAVARALRRERPGALTAPGVATARGGSPQPVALDGRARSVDAVERSLRDARRRNAARSRLERALGAVAEAGRTLDVWWRDDDAVSDTPALRRLLALAAHHGAPLALAVVPARADASLAALLADREGVEVLQHGYAHADNAKGGQKKIELGGSSPAVLVHAELEVGLRKLARVFDGRFRPILVPPWNRIDPSVLAGLGALGFSGLSTFRNRRAAEAVPGLAEVNTHWDPIAWKAGGGLRDEADLWTELAVQVEDRLAGRADAGETLGLLTHHLVHDPWIWRMLEDVLTLMAGHPSVRLRTAAFAFGIHDRKSPGIDAAPGDANRPP